MLERGLSILRCFRPGEQDLPLTEIARRADLPKTTAHRIVAELVRGDMLERSNRGLRLGRGLFMLAVRVPHQVTLSNIAGPHAEWLHRALRASAFVFAVDGAGPDAALVHSARQDHSVAETEVSVLAATRVVRAFARSEVAGLVASTSQLRAQGFATLRSRDAVGIAAPVLTTASSPVGVLAVVGPIARLDPRSAVEHLRAACAAISRALAHGPELVAPRDAGRAQSLPATNSVGSSRPARYSVQAADSVSRMRAVESSP
ncbi:hypothetical protein GCM10027436_80720 [Actinophytocola sediminis]